jgi:hypothetical protein
LPIAVGALIVFPPYAGGTVRPKTVVYFEWIIFGTLLLEVLQTYLSWDQAIAITATMYGNSAVAVNLIAQIFSFVLFATLTLLVSRRRSKIAMWVSIALFALGLAVFVVGNIRALLLESVTFMLAVLQCIGQFVAYALLFTPSARRWMNREDEKNERLREVFH